MLVVVRCLMCKIKVCILRLNCIICHDAVKHTKLCRPHFGHVVISSLQSLFLSYNLKITMQQVLALLLDVILWVLEKMAVWIELCKQAETASKEEILKMAKSGLLVFGYCSCAGWEKHNVHIIISKHSESTTIQNLKCCGWSRNTSEQFLRRMKIT